MFYMKKIITAIITIALLLAFVTFNVSAEEPKNYLQKDAVWGGVAATSTVKDGIVTSKTTGVAWSSPSIPLLSSLKAALGDADEVEISIIFKAKVTFKAGSDAESASGSVLFRGTNTLTETENDAWNNAYAELLGDDEALFMMSGGHVLYYIDGIRCEMYPDEWTECRVDFFVTKGQLNCTAITEWTFCMDSFGETIAADIDTIEIKDFGVYLTEDVPEEEEEDKEVDKPVTEETKPTPTPTPTPKPQTPSLQTPNLGNNTNTDATQNADATPTVEPTETTDNSDMSGLIIAIVVLVAVIGIAAVTVVVVLKKKKQG
jgi:hypothetical protein